MGLNALISGVYWTPSESYVCVVKADQTYQWLGIGYKMDGVYSPSGIDTKVSPVTLVEWID